MFFISFFITFALGGCSNTNQITNARPDGIWNHYFVHPISTCIIYFGHLFNENYVFSIILITIIVRILLCPFAIYQYKSQKNMEDLQPLLVELKKKYDSSNPEEQKQLHVETINLFKKQGINPLNGFFSLLIQFPIFTAMYHAIVQTQEVSNSQFLWFSLGHSDSYYILPIIASICTYIQLRVALIGRTRNTNKLMHYISPLLILIFGTFSPSALIIYWISGSLFVTLQTLIFKYTNLINSGNRVVVSK